MKRLNLLKWKFCNIILVQVSQYSAYPGRPEVATGLPLIGTDFTLQNIEVFTLHGKRSVNRVVQKDVKGVYTVMVKDQSTHINSGIEWTLFCTPCRPG